MRIDQRVRPEKRNYIFIIVTIILCLRHILQLIGLSGIASTLFQLLYIVTALFMAAGLIKALLRNTAQSLLILFLGLCVMAYLAWNLLFRYSAYLEPSLPFVLTFPLIFSFDKLSVSEKEAKLFFRGIITIGILLSVLVFVPSGYKNGILLLYTLNGNQCGLLYMVIFWGVAVYQFLREKKNWLLYIVMALLFFGCWRTESRTSIISCVLLVVLVILLNKSPGKKKTAFISAMVAFVVIPFVVSFLVEWLGADFEILGASAWTGREDLWPEVIETLLAEPLGIKVHRVVRDFYGTDLGTHNAWLSVAWKYSVPVAFVFIASLFYMGRHILQCSMKKRGAVLLGCFICGLLHMSFEAAIITGALDYSLYFLMILLGAKAMVNGQESNI